METDNALADPQVLIRARACWDNNADQFNQWHALGLDGKIELISKEQCCPGDFRFFIKSGNRVRLIARGASDWEVERIDGASSGKRMLCLAGALVWCLPGMEEPAVSQIESTF